ncbi:cellulase [Biscogniauxia mediterranea]|nr:cellulase [Biscogniauxia mediterranea]
MARNNNLALGFALLGLAVAQKPGATPDTHPQLTTYRCTVADGCTEATNYIVLDSTAHGVHQVNDSSLGCGDWGSGPDPTACPTVEACAENCVMEGVTDYSTVGVTTDGTSLRLLQIVDGVVKSPRIYLLDEKKEQYEMVKFTGGEFTFDIDATHLPCGMNSALYLSEMLPDGGQSELNPGGAAWGTGYCDAQCYVTPWVNGIGNVEAKGVCCNEMDIWEANARATQIAPHTCNQTAVYLCEGAECERDGVCDKSGCGWNPYRLDQPNYYGEGADFSVDTTKPFTVVTQFPADESGNLIEIHRIYVQGGKVIAAETVQKEGLPQVAFENDEYCAATGATKFMSQGAMKGMGDAMTRGMVLAFSLWWDEGSNMSWLDGAAEGAGPCNATEGNPESIQVIEPSPEVTFSNLKWGEIGSTFSATV